MRRAPRFRSLPPRAVASAPPGPAPALTDDDRRAILSVCDNLIATAGRTTLAMALRGSQAKRVLQYHVDQARGYGFYAGVPEAEVLARIDALIAEGVLCLHYRDGFPLLGYTASGLALAMRFAADEWLAVLRSCVPAVARGAALELPPIVASIQARNQNTVLLLVDLVAREADPAWLPLLRAWQAVETRRVRGRLAPLIATLERAPSQSAPPPPADGSSPAGP